MPTLFLSHSSKDKFFVRKLAEELTQNGVKVWIDEAEIKIGDSLIEKITAGVKDADYLVIVLSHNSVESTWVQKELQMAISREMLGTKVILPLLIEKCEIPLFLQDKLYADFTNPDHFDKSFTQLLHAVGIENNQQSQKAATKKKKTRKDILKEEPILPRELQLKYKLQQSQLELFEDIKIVGVDKNKTYNPDPSKKLFNVYFNLSHSPSREWVEIFDAERRVPRHTMWRKAWIEDTFIVVHCCLNEIKKYHLLDITEDVLNSNNKYREYLKNIEMQQQRKASREEKEKHELNEVLDSLEF
ncbi:toll/interleukin-1 receptor domain-containing protein [Paenibacillus sp. MER TA 81-3]|uniref:toll/interleukin-1 receptor domain-containing protein n=1 Tax=Paenibacillus sp. MER TA 81-3 TaxID=2939573 RepID=UPI00203BDE86|nr:toll/interleukin-1 receptor domain-containing protein [Paenibacillus sp. MER TA 81-3]MCM3342725.1 toll/interleukin-1 receptor domain-containing protein [Paenibacillus sp. MER TA 81-3]